uniref:hypothetical protein n=1 Tax=Actinomyces oris TaxID=544580 RepID=UPI0028D28F63
MTAPHTPTRFLDRHLGTTGADLDTVLTSIGARSLEDLAVRVVPTTLPVLDPLPCWWSRVVRGWASCCG